jgi:hypothetical protein
MSLVFQNIDPHPPLRPPLLGGGGEGRTHSPGGVVGGGGSIFWKTRDIGLPSLIISLRLKLTGDIENGETLLSGVKATVKRYREGAKDN